MSRNSHDFWKAKLIAFLHDPPDKCFDISNHEQFAESFKINAGFKDEERKQLSKCVKRADFYASAADRFLFPLKTAETTFDGKNGSTFIHPLSSIEFVINDLDESAKNAIHEKLLNAAAVCDNEDWRKKHFLYWRLWLDESVGNDEYTQYLAFLPAETRIPDHSIWHHMAVTSAFAGCLENDEMKPAFLLFQLGGVQNFIAQARSTRDLWSGSYLLSWLIAHALKAISDHIGPDAIIYPHLRNNGIFDILYREEMYSEEKWRRMYKEKEITPCWFLTPTIPNRFLALVPESRAEELAHAAESAIHAELRTIGNAVWQWLTNETPRNDSDKQLWKKRWDAQIEAFPNITWAVQPWLDHGTCLKEFEKLPVNKVDNETPYKKRLSFLNAGSYITNDQPVELNQTGILWSAHYALVDAKLAARRNTSDFKAWNDPVLDKMRNSENEHEKELFVKDSLSGKEECIGDKEFWDCLHNCDNKLFPEAHRYGAMNLIKRL